ncbi:MAG TPA: hypothetical protein VFH06_03485 [Candidatus Saccharimonadales bacterium]|nr:hypothetical protein [Candidatus Saccharimonadales bacterium]
MIVLLHVSIAVASLVLVTHTFFKPANKTLFASYGSILATLMSGLYLVLIEPARMPHTCEVGLIYLVIAVTMTLMARTRLLSTKKSEKTL